MTAHELARKLLELPDVPVTYVEREFGPVSDPEEIIDMDFVVTSVALASNEKDHVVLQ